MQLLALVHALHPVGHKLQFIEPPEAAMAYIPTAQPSQLNALVSHLVHPVKHLLQTFMPVPELVMPYPTPHPPISQAPAPLVKQVIQLSAQGWQSPLLSATKLEEHAVQKSATPHAIQFEIVQDEHKDLDPRVNVA